MTYTPTEQELIEMGFKKCDDWFVIRIPPTQSAWIAFKYENVGYKTTEKDVWLCMGRKFYPYSKTDIETLIRLFTKPE